jgi:hypothetical protein
MNPSGFIYFPETPSESKLSCIYKRYTIIYTLALRKQGRGRGKGTCDSGLPPVIPGVGTSKAFMNPSGFIYFP